MATQDTETLHENLVREYVSLEDRIAPDIARMEEIKKVLRDLDYGTHNIAGLKVSIGHNTRLDAEAFAAKYPVLKYPHLYKSAPDSTAIKEHLAPAEIKSLSKEGEKRFGIK